MAQCECKAYAPCPDHAEEEAPAAAGGVMLRADLEVYEGITIWRCPECAFGMDAVHAGSDTQDGQWDCPGCGTIYDGDGNVVEGDDNG